MKLSASTISIIELPPAMQEIVDLVGVAAALALSEHFGGLVLQVPHSFREDHIITEVVGEVAAKKLSQRFGAYRLYIAKLDDALRLQRNIEIAGRYDAGVSVNVLARDYGLSVRHIWNILKRPETLQPPTNQIDLFSTKD